jgi:hypothetical protein
MSEPAGCRPQDQRPLRNKRYGAKTVVGGRDVGVSIHHPSKNRNRASANQVTVLAPHQSGMLSRALTSPQRLHTHKRVEPMTSNVTPITPDAHLGHNAPHHPRNEAMPLDLGWVRDVRVNLSATERRVATLPGRRTVKKDAQAAWLLKALTCIDLTTLNGDDTEGRVRRLCAKAASLCASGFA